MATEASCHRGDSHAGLRMHVEVLRVDKGKDILDKKKDDVYGMLTLVSFYLKSRIHVAKEILNFVIFKTT